MKLTCLRKVIVDKEYENIIKDMLSNEKVLLMKTFIQHGRTSTLEHCVNVSYKSYKAAKYLNLDFKSVARGALLHDMYLYDWHGVIPEDIDKRGKHAFYHPKVALENAVKNFKLNKTEREIILRHMWPVTPVFPKTKEAWIIVYYDKYCAFMEFIIEKRIKYNKKLKKFLNK